MGTYTAMVMRSAGSAPEPEQRQIPEPGHGEALVRLRATSMNYHDLVNLRGVIRGPWPRVPMSDGSGEVVAVGAGVANLAIGQRVNLPFSPLWLSGPPSAVTTAAANVSTALYAGVVHGTTSTSP